MRHALSARGAVRPIRIEDTGHDLSIIREALAEHTFDRLVLAEGDSWFDLFTPLFARYQPNLLSALRVPRPTALVDLSRIGDTAKDMTSGWQAIRTAEILDEIPFNVWLVSAGGNDLIAVFVDLFAKAALSKRTGFAKLTPQEESILKAPGTASDEYDKIIANILKLVAMRDASKGNRTTPMIFHGYDYLQPRPAPAVVLPGISEGPWIYPVLKAHGLSADEMRQIAHDVINTFNDRLSQALAGKPNVHFLDQRGTLTLAAPGTTAESNDWADEIHPLPGGFDKLAKLFWNPLLEQLLA